MLSIHFDIGNVILKDGGDVDLEIEEYQRCLMASGLDAGGLAIEQQRNANRI